MDNLNQATQSLPVTVSDARINSLDAEYFGTWTFSTLVRGDEWNPALFTDVLKDCAPNRRRLHRCRPNRRLGPRRLRGG